MAERIFSLSRVTPDTSLDTVQNEKLNNKNYALDVLFQAQNAWMSMATFRQERERNKRYTFGKQWDDIITTADGETMSEESYIKKQGSVPLKNNIIMKLVRTVIGTYRSQMKEPTCIARDREEQKLGETMSVILQCNMQLNRMQGINARSIQELLISGLIVHRKWFGPRNDKCDCWTDYVQPNNVFMDPNMRDFRGWDIGLIGEIHDVPFNKVCQQYAKCPDDVEWLRLIYHRDTTRQGIYNFYNQFGEGSYMSSRDFFIPEDPSLCRVIEVWRKESKPRYRCHDFNNGDIYKIEIDDYDELVGAKNRKRIEQGVKAGMKINDIPLIKTQWFMDDYWYFYFLTPWGDVLKEGETPYEHKSHPYVFKAYPFIDGEIHSFVSDIIDQQRYINRLITLHDWIMRASAKGVLIFPEDCLRDEDNPDDIFDAWSRFDGVIIAKKGAQNLPQQISNNSTNIGIGELLNLQLKLIEDISGVNGSLQGKPGYSGTSASLYAQQTQNATISLLDILDTYSEFVIDGAYKDVKNMQQYYDTKRVFNIVGKPGVEIEYDPKKIRDVEFDVSIVESTSTPAYRMMANDFLKEIWRANQISLQQLLRYGDFPFADELLQNLESQQEQLEQGNTPDGLSPEMLQQVQSQANMENVNNAYKILSN